MTRYLKLFILINYLVILVNNSSVLNAQPGSSAGNPAFVKEAEDHNLKTENEDLQKNLDEYLKENDRLRKLLKASELEKDALDFQKFSRMKNESRIGEELKNEITIRKLREAELRRIKGNLFYPGMGQILNNNSRGYFWAGMFTLSLTGFFMAQNDTVIKESQMKKNSWNPGEYSGMRSAYRQSYLQYQSYGALSAAMYFASLTDASFSYSNDTGDSVGRNAHFSGPTIQFSFRWTAVF
jgi:hypothetical protein